MLLALPAFFSLPKEKIFHSKLPCNSAKKGVDQMIYSFLLAESKNPYRNTPNPWLFCFEVKNEKACFFNHWGGSCPFRLQSPKKAFNNLR